MRHWGKYIFVFLLTVGIFAISWYVSYYFNQKKLNELHSIQDKVATDLMSSETQFSLLEEMSCTDINNSVISGELATLADKLAYSESNVGTPEQIKLLKDQYSILEVKDYLLNKRIGERCGHPPFTIFYFYGDKNSCTDCQNQGYVLDTLRANYPTLRIYSFDYNLNSATVRALKSIYRVSGTLPALVVNGKTINGFQSFDALTALLPKDLTNPTPQKPVKPAHRPKMHVTLPTDPAPVLTAPTSSVTPVPAH